MVLTRSASRAPSNPPQNLDAIAPSPAPTSTVQQVLSSLSPIKERTSSPLSTIPSSSPSQGVLARLRVGATATTASSPSKSIQDTIFADHNLDAVAAALNQVFAETDTTTKGPNVEVETTQLDGNSTSLAGSSAMPSLVERLQNQLDAQQKQEVQEKEYTSRLNISLKQGEILHYSLDYEDVATYYYPALELNGGTYAVPPDDLQAYFNENPQAKRPNCWCRVPAAIFKIKADAERATLRGRTALRCGAKGTKPCRYMVILDFFLSKPAPLCAVYSRPGPDGKTIITPLPATTMSSHRRTYGSPSASSLSTPTPPPLLAPSHFRPATTPLPTRSPSPPPPSQPRTPSMARPPPTQPRLPFGAPPPYSRRLPARTTTFIDLTKDDDNEASSKPLNTARERAKKRSLMGDSEGSPVKRRKLLESKEKEDVFGPKMALKTGTSTNRPQDKKNLKGKGRERTEVMTAALLRDHLEELYPAAYESGFPHTKWLEWRQQFHHCLVCQAVFFIVPGETHHCSR